MTIPQPNQPVPTVPSHELPGVIESRELAVTPPPPLDPVTPPVPAPPSADLGHGGADAGVSTEPSLHAPGSPLESLLMLAGAVARRESPVLLHGESGTGKEVLARWMHARSQRRDGPFVPVNCAAISASLIESELFGHCRGAFTHAVTDRPGHVRQADGGTLFLDEIGDMPPDLQARLLRVLQEKTVRPVGGDTEVPVDFRLICATHRDLAAEVRAGRFREDLYYRLRVLELRLPPLRDRPVDIPFLLRAFLTEMAGPEVADDVHDLPVAVLRHHFPGNIRELRNLAERYAAMREVGGGWEQAFEGSARLSDQVREAVPGYARSGRNTRLTDYDVLAALEACGHHRARAAAMLGVNRRTLQYHLAKMRLQAEQGGIGN
jgi:DNA-binding NtrC family response regulator